HTIYLSDWSSVVCSSDLSCVAEVIGFQTPSEMTGAPPWYIGTVPWNGKAVPLVSFEGACGQMIPPASGRTRIVILHALGTRVEEIGRAAGRARVRRAEVT